MTKENVHKEHRKRVKEKFLNHGLKTFADHEILELMLFFSLPQIDTNKIAHDLLNKFKSIKGVFEASYESLLTVKDVGPHTATLIKFLPELMNVYSKSLTTEISKISSQDEAEEYVTNLFKNTQHEKFVIICLNARNEITTCEEISSGDQNKVQIEIRNVTNAILKNDCQRVILTHNHPHGLAKPSDDDVNVTHKLFYSCILNDIVILDHIIYAPDGCFSFAQHQLLDDINSDVATLFSNDSTKYKNFCTSTASYSVNK